MKVSDFKIKFTSLKNTSTVLLASNLVLVTMLAISLVINFNKDTVVINNMNESCQNTIMGSNFMNEDSHKRVGFYLSNVLGNITPSTAEYVDIAVMPFVAPEIYQDVKDLLALQLSELTQDELTMTFHPESFQFESGITFVTGKGELRGITGQRDKFIRTYEFELDVQNYSPTLRYIAVYNDIPHDRAWKRKQAAIAERKAEKGK